MELKIGNGYDVHALADGLPMWLGGVRIPSDRGFVAHSDGDVAIHALCDALLGALALGDIGHLFPDNAPAWKGIDSKILLEKEMPTSPSPFRPPNSPPISLPCGRPSLRSSASVSIAFLSKPPPPNASALSAAAKAARSGPPCCFIPPGRSNLSPPFAHECEVYRQGTEFVCAATVPALYTRA